MLPILPKREYMLLGAAYRTAAEILSWPDAEFYRVNDKISHWSPAQELHHIGLANGIIFDRIELLYGDEDPGIARKGRLTWLGFKVMTFGKIPRGVTKAGPTMEPPVDVVREQVAATINASKKKMTTLAGRLEYLHTLRGRWQHGPYGYLTAMQWLRLSRLHTQFHLRIAQQIREGES